MAFHPHQCDYCARGIDGVLTPGDYNDCTLTHKPGERDPECPICYFDMIEGEALIRHDPCQHVYHKTCMDRWVDTVASNNNAPMPADCGFCRGPVMHLKMEPAHTMIASVVRNASATFERLMDMFAHGARVRTMPKKLLARLMDLDSDPPPLGLQVFQRYILPQKDWLSNQSIDREVTSDACFRICPGDDRPPGMELFHGTDTVYAGALDISHCLHRREVLFMAADKLGQICSRLFAEGWCPEEGHPVWRVQLAQARWLSDVIQAAKSLHRNAVQITAVELASLFPHSERMRRGQRLFITLIREQDRPRWWQARHCAYEINADNSLQLLDHAEVSRFIQELGGLGENTVAQPFHEDQDELERRANRLHLHYFTALQPLRHQDMSVAN